MTYPAPPERVLLFIALAILTSIGITQWLESGEPATYPAIVRAENTRVFAPADAVVQKWHAKLGEEVHCADPLVDLDDAKLTLSLSKAQHASKTLASKLKRAEAQAKMQLSLRLKEVDQEVLSTKLKSSNLLKEQFEFQVEDLAWSNYIMEQDTLKQQIAQAELAPVAWENSNPDEARIRAMLRLEAARNAAEVYNSQISMCDERLQQLATLKKNLPNMVQTAAGVEVAKAELAQVQSQLEYLQQQHNRLKIISQSIGTVGRIHKQEGEAVTRGELLLELLDEHRRYLDLQIPSDELPNYAVGKKVTVEFPGQELCEGQIASIGFVARHDADGISPNSQIQVRINPTGKLWPKIPIGSVVAVTLDD